MGTRMLVNELPRVSRVLREDVRGSTASADVRAGMSALVGVRIDTRCDAWAKRNPPHLRCGVDLILDEAPSVLEIGMHGCKRVARLVAEPEHGFRMQHLLNLTEVVGVRGGDVCAQSRFRRGEIHRSIAIAIGDSGNGQGTRAGEERSTRHLGPCQCRRNGLHTGIGGTLAAGSASSILASLAICSTSTAASRCTKPSSAEPQSLSTTSDARSGA
jgi:hypothetical protein